MLEKEIVGGQNHPMVNDLLIITPTLDNIEFIMMYYQQIGIIKDWFIGTDEYSLITKHVSHMQYMIKKSEFLLDRFTNIMPLLIPITRVKTQLHQASNFCKFPIVQRKDLYFGVDKYNFDMVITCNENDMKFESMCGNKWYKINYLNYLDFPSVVKWTFRFENRFIDKVNGGHYLVHIKVLLADEWMDEITKK